MNNGNRYVIKGSPSFAHNANFLQELCRSKRFQEGRTPTSFIDEEFPDGFEGVTLSPNELATSVAAAIVVHTQSAISIAGASEAGLPHEAGEGSSGSGTWVVVLADEGHSTALAKSGAPSTFEVTHGEEEDNTLCVTPIDENGEAIGEAMQLPLVDLDWPNDGPLIEMDVGNGPKVTCLAAATTALAQPLSN